MGIFQAVVTLCGVIGIIGLLFVLFCHHFPRWTWTQCTSYLFRSTMEEKMVLTKPNPSGCMIPCSESSEFTLSGRGSFRRFDKTDHDYTLLRHSSSSSLSRQEGNIPPQPLRPAPIPPYIIGGPLQQPQRSTCGINTPFTTTHPFDSLTIQHQGNSFSAPTRGGGGGNEGSSGLSSFSNNNPFLPLIQASTQFLQKFQPFQPSQNGSGASGHAANRCGGSSQSQTTLESRQQSVASHSLDESYPVVRPAPTSTSSGLSMGEILFSTTISSPPAALPKEIQKGKETKQSMNLETIDVDNLSKGIDTKHTFPVNAIPPAEKKGDRRSQDKEESQRERSHSCTEQLEDKKHINSFSAANLNVKSTSVETINKTEFPQTHHNSPSPTRIRDRQRKMELTLQHIQNNQEDRMMTKKHYNPDSHYPISTPYVPKMDVSGSESGKSRFRSPLRSVPTLKESDEEAVAMEPIPATSSTLIKSSGIPLDLKDEALLLPCNKWILETMREEIRIENERMEDATKSLMMEDDFSGNRRKSNGQVEKRVESVQTAKSFDSPGNTNRREAETGLSFAAKDCRDNAKIFYANFNGGSKVNSKVNTNNSRSSEINASQVSDRQFGEYGHNPNNGASVSMKPILGERALSYTIPANPSMLSNPPFRNIRSFSLRQSSTDSVASEGSESGSPDGSLPSLQRAMSCDSVSSDTSIVMSDLDPPHPTGYLCVGLEYDCETADLLVNVMEAKELVGPDPNSSLAFDSYVRVYLLPDKTTNMQTRVYRKSLSPIYREKFMFGVETIELPLRTLVFYLYATDKHSTTLVGETEVKLGDIYLGDIYQPITTTWLLLTDTGQRGGESGEIMFSLSYLPTAERLTVVVVKARNLKFPHERETGDPFVKVYLLQKGKKVSKKKSSTKRGEKNPIFNEAMIFSVPAHALQTIQLRITVADSSEAEGRANSIGHVMVGSSATGKSLSHWNQMLSSLRKPIAMWHLIRK